MAVMTDDPYLWLEDIAGDDALDWVRARNEPTVAKFCDAEFVRMRGEALEVLDTDARIPYVVRRGDYLYNFWRDAANPRGLWRRTTLDGYRSDSPEWDVLIDIDELGRADNEKWVWAGATVIEGIKIAAGCIVGAGATVVHDLTESGTYVGSPARRIR